jgi:hypothetical protein
MNVKRELADNILLTQIHNFMEESLLIYKAYLQNGKTYKYAKELRRVNNETTLLLEKNITILITELNTAAKLLIDHYTIWRSKWDELENELNPSDDDEFVFQNNHTFPKNAALLFESAYQSLK